MLIIIIIILVCKKANLQYNLVHVFPVFRLLTSRFVRMENHFTFLSIQSKSFLFCSFFVHFVNNFTTMSIPMISFSSSYGVCSCSICLEALKEPVELPCQHICCLTCASQWFSKEQSCPLCRKTVPRDFRLETTTSLR